MSDKAKAAQKRAVQEIIDENPRLQRAQKERDVYLQRLYRRSGQIDDAIAQHLKPSAFDKALEELPEKLGKAMQDALGESSPASAPKPPKHKFWGAGEEDCPKEIKARNGELCAMLCKVCGVRNPPDEFCWHDECIQAAIDEEDASAPNDAAASEVAKQLLERADSASGVLPLPIMSYADIELMRQAASLLNKETK